MILHLVTKAEWDAKPADQPYLPDAFKKDGFIHCTQGDALILEVANRVYKTVPGDFFAVGIDETKVTSPVKWEAPADPTPAIRSVDSAVQPAPATGTVKPVDLPPEVQAEVGSQASALTGTSAVPAPAESGAEVKPAPVRFPHIYGPLNRDAIMGVRRVLRAADGAFTGFAPLEISPTLSTPPQTRLKTPSELANELVEATGDFSEALARYKDNIEAHMDELDKNIKDL
jgi:uncharacterized protein (DUF952 family)